MDVNIKMTIGRKT